MSLLDQPTVTPREGRIISFGADMRPIPVKLARKKANRAACQKWRENNPERNAAIQLRFRLRQKLKRAQDRLRYAQRTIAKCRRLLEEMEAAK